MRSNRRSFLKSLPAATVSGAILPGVLSASEVTTPANARASSAEKVLIYGIDPFDWKDERILLFVERAQAHRQATFWELVARPCTWQELRCAYPGWYRHQFKSAWFRDDAPDRPCWRDWYPEGDTGTDPVRLVQVIGECGEDVTPVETDMLEWVPESVRALGSVGWGVDYAGLQLAPEAECEIVAAFEALGYRCQRDDALIRVVAGADAFG